MREHLNKTQEIPTLVHFCLRPLIQLKHESVKPFSLLLALVPYSQGTVGSMLRDQWGVSATCTDLHTLKQKIKEGQSSQAAQVVQPSADVAASKGEGDQDLPEPLSSGR